MRRVSRPRRAERWRPSWRSTATSPSSGLPRTHLDEVFNRGRLPLYIRLTKAAQQVPGVRRCITFHTVADRNDAMRKEIDPFDDTDGAGHDFGVSFPGPGDRADLVPTRLWEAMREGGDDLRCIATDQAHGFHRR